MNINKFNLIVGESIMYCQNIEHDIKLILAGMTKGDFDRNYEACSEDTLGEAIKKLEMIDNSDGNPTISRNDYRFLKTINSKRIFLVHKMYNEFVYIKKWPKSKEYKNIAKDLVELHKKLKETHVTIQKMRLKILKQFGRL